MADQTLIFVALPNGLSSSGNLQLSIYLSPRLSGGPTLASFPDFVDWTSRAARGLTFTLSCGSAEATVEADRGRLRPDIWQSIFTAGTLVDGYSIGDFDQRLIVSYPSRDAYAYLKYAYQRVGSTVEGLREIRELLEDLVFRDGDVSTLDQEMAEMRVALWLQQHPPVTDVGGIRAVDVDVRPPQPPVDGVGTSLSPPSNIHSTMTQFALYHHLPPAPGRPPLPSTSEDFEGTLDFHRALSALASYPSVLRALGLVFDVEVPGSLCPPSPSSGAYATIAVTAVIPAFTWGLEPTLVTSSTSYVSSPTSFQTAPLTGAGSEGTGLFVAGDVVDGFLALQPQDYYLSQVDVDGSLLKALGLADNATRGTDAAAEVNDLPSMRTAGLSLLADGRAMQLLDAIGRNSELDQAMSGTGSLPRPLCVTDVLRGYRLDVWDAHSGAWHSLHRRRSSYKFGADGSVSLDEADEEGFLHPAVAGPADDPTRPSDPVATENSIPQPGSDLYIHERMARWSGWSLSASRPGLALNRSVDPSLATTPDPTLGEPMTPFKMRTSFIATPRTLPELRFGRQYRLRARAVDLAGNSVALAANVPDQYILPSDGLTFPYRRFEPVPPPIVVLRDPTAPGGSLLRLVIRSFNDSPEFDTVVTSATDERFIAPPRTSVAMVEQLGMVDDPSGHLRGDAATYTLLADRDAYTIPTRDGVPEVSSIPFEVGYLPDPLARGAAFANLPGAPDDTSGRAGSVGLDYQTLPGVQSQPGSATFVGFGDTWPQRHAFLLSLGEGDAPPSWDDGPGLLSVSLPKAAVVDAQLSSFVYPADLDILGIWVWLQEWFDAQAEQLVESGGGPNLTAFSDEFDLLTRLVLEGGHPLLTPGITLTLVHAVQQPLGLPDFVQLPVVHLPSVPICASGLRNDFTPITAWRSVDSYYAVLLGGLQINAASTSRIDLRARVLEVTDDPTAPAPTEIWQGQQIETIKIADSQPGPIFSDATDTRMVATYIPEVDVLWFSAPFDVLDGVTTPDDVAAPLHRFNDSKHRWVTYEAVATTRFQEYFPASDSLDFTRTGQSLLVDVPSSAPPAPPDVVYVVPTFGWQTEETTNVKSAVRFGNGLRVYLNRPWYSSGDNELLGVAVWPASEVAPDAPTRELFKAYFTQWGNDPIWATGTMSAVPSVDQFPLAVATASDLAVPGTTLKLDVAGHQVAFDGDRRLWYCDIELANESVYAPFVRLALLRYQPHSITGVECSIVALADFAQLVPDRSAVLSVDSTDNRSARLYLGGLGPDAPRGNVVTVTIESRIPNMTSDAGWEAAPNSVVVVTEDVPAPNLPGSVLWAGGILFQSPPSSGSFRVVVREYEQIPVDLTLIRDNLGVRLVYAATIPYDFPVTGPSEP